MLKGISLQLNAITNHLNTQLTQNDITWESYFLNTEKNSSQLLKLARIAFTQLDEYLPKDVGLAFDRASTALRNYFKARPKGEVEQEDTKDIYRSDYDEVQRFLDNKPVIVTNDEQRGELFKFLAMNEQKEKNNRLLLEEMPKFNNDYAYHPLRNKSAINTNTLESNPILPRIQEVAKPNSKGTPIGGVKIQTKGSIYDKRTSVETRQEEVQTDWSLVCAKDISFQDSFISVEGKPSIFLNNAVSQTLQPPPNSVNSSVDVPKIQLKGELSESIEESSEEHKERERKKKVKGTLKEQVEVAPNDENVQKQNENEQTSAEGRASIITSTKKIAKEDSLPKFNFKNKKNADKRQSSNSLSTSRKDIVKGINPKKGNRKSKEPKQSGGKRASDSKISKQKKDQSPSRFVPTIMQTQQEMLQSVNYKPQKQEQSQQMNEFDNKNTSIYEGMKEGEEKEHKDFIKIEQIQKEAQPQQIQTNQVVNSIKKYSQKESSEREKVISSKEETSHSDFLIDQAYNTAGNAFYRKPSKAQQQTQSTLPRIDQKRRLQRVQSLKRKIYESSPYAKGVLQLDQKQMKNSNSSMQLNHRSLHLNPDNLYLKSTLSPKDTNATRQRTEIREDSDYRAPSTYRLELKGLGQQEKEGLLRQEHLRVVREIEENVGRRGKPQWTKVMRSIRHYELMHATLCGENCIHLNKFYEFLKKKNLASCLNRKELPLHKKNIQINTSSI